MHVRFGLFVVLLESLLMKVRDCFNSLKDARKGLNTSYSFSDVCMAGYSVFHLQSPSFLAHQERLEKKHTTHNGKTLFGFSKTPSHNQIRHLLDTIDPQDLNSLFDSLQSEVKKEDFSSQEGLVVALDGTYFFSSERVCCARCLSKTKEGKTRYFHAMLCPALIHPEQKCALPMAPEFILQEDGKEKQDCELNAAKRWINAKKDWLRQERVTLLGDDLFSRAPLISQVIELETVRFIFVAKPASHKYLQEWIQNFEKKEGGNVKTTEKKGSKKLTYVYRFFKDIPLNATATSPLVNYFDILVKDEKEKIIYHNSFVTNHAIDEKNIHHIARMGRDRWKIENEAFNILKTKGYNLEHNFGHGHENLSNIFLCFNLIAFLIHHLCEVGDTLYQNLRRFFGERVRFFQTLATFLGAKLFTSWQEFFGFMLEISEPAPK